MPSARDQRWIGAEFDRRADTYDTSTMHVWQADLAAAILEPTVETKLILDVATGTGLAARALTQRSQQDIRIVGIDLSFGMLEVAARRSSSNCSFVRADAQYLPFASDTFDAVICVSAVPYFPDVAAAVAEWKRVARTDAVIVFTTPAEDGITSNRLLRAAAAQHGVDLPDPHGILGTPENIRTAAPGFGLKVDHIEQQSFPELLIDDPRKTFDKIIDYGFAEPLKNLPREKRQAIYFTYRGAHITERAAGGGAHTVLVTRCTVAEVAFADPA